MIRGLLAALVILAGAPPTQASADDRKLYAYFHAICVATDGESEAVSAAINKYGFEPLGPLPPHLASSFPPGARLFALGSYGEPVWFAGTMIFDDPKTGPVRTCMVGGGAYSDWLFEAVSGLASVPKSAVASRPETRETRGDIAITKRLDAYAFIKGPTGHRPLAVGDDGVAKIGPDDRLISIDTVQFADFSTTTLIYGRTVEPEQ